MSDVPGDRLREDRTYMTGHFSMPFHVSRQREVARQRNLTHVGALAWLVRRHARQRGNVLVWGSIRLTLDGMAGDVVTCTVRWREWLMVAPQDRAALADLDIWRLGDAVFAQPLGAGWQLIVP